MRGGFVWLTTAAAQREVVEPSAAASWGRRRGDLVALPFLLLFLGLPPNHHGGEGYLWLCAAADTATGIHHQNETRDVAGPPVATAPITLSKQSSVLVAMPNFYNKNLSRSGELPSPDGEKNTTSADYDVRVGGGRRYAKYVDRFRTGRKKTDPRELRRYRRAAAVGEPRSTVASWTVQPTPSLTDWEEIMPTFGRSTTAVPDVRTLSASVRLESDLGVTYARLSVGSPWPTPSSSVPAVPATSGPLPAGGATSRRDLNPSPSQANPDPPRTLSALLSPSPTPSRSTPPPWSRSPAATPRSGPVGWRTPAPGFNSTVDQSDSGTASHRQTETDAPTTAAAIPGELGTETRPQPSSATALSTGLFSHNSSTTNSTRTPADTTSSGPPQLGPPKGGANVPSVKQSGQVYTIVTEIKTSPSILTIMPCLVGMALLGLLAAAVKRCVVHRRLRHMVELTSGDPEKRGTDKGYTIENPMAKDRRSYVERQMEKTLSRVNKTESNSSSNNNHSSSTSSSSRSNSNSSGRNAANAKPDDKIRMEIATISDGSLRRPVRPLRRSASERGAPSRRRSSGGYFTSSHTECRCYCHYPLGGREGRPLTNGGAGTDTATTRL